MCVLFLCSFAFCFGVKSDASAVFLIWLSGGGWERDRLEKSFFFALNPLWIKFRASVFFCEHRLMLARFLFMRTRVCQLEF